MAIEFEHGIDLEQSPASVFAVLDDFQQTPKWLARCSGIESLTAGPNAVGTKLRYSHWEGCPERRRAGTMEGEIVERSPGEKLVLRYEDKMMLVRVHFRLAPTGTGTRLVHRIEISPKTFMAKLMSPMIRRMVPKQTIEAMEKLRSVLAASA